MRVEVTTACSGQGRCYTLAKHVYQDDDDGYNSARGTTFTVADALAEEARTGAVACPEGAIIITD